MNDIRNQKFVRFPVKLLIVFFALGFGLYVLAHIFGTVSSTTLEEAFRISAGISFVLIGLKLLALGYQFLERRAPGVVKVLRWIFRAIGFVFGLLFAFFQKSELSWEERQALEDRRQAQQNIANGRR